MNDPQTIHQIGSAIYQVVATTHQRQPELLTEKWRSWDWQNPDHEVAFIEKLMAKLGKATSPSVLMTEVEQVLKLLLMHPFFESLEFQNLLAQVCQLAGVSPENRSGNGENPTVWRNGAQADIAAIAILLLDAENLQPDVETEKFLASVCTHPLRVKLAFANWRRLGKQDVEFHNRHYDMFHVPEGSDMADGKMIAIGTSIREHYPLAREVLVCSSDKVMTNLCTKLQQQGLVVYQVRKQDARITVTNRETGETKLYPNPSSPGVPSLENCLLQLKQMVKVEQQRTSNPWVKLAKVSQLFKEKNGCNLSQVISIHAPGKKVRDFFTDHWAEFAVHQYSNQGELYLTLFEMAEPGSVKEPAMVTSNDKDRAPFSDKQTGTGTRKTQEMAPSKPIKIITPAELEQRLVNIVRTLTAQGNRIVMKQAKF